MATWLTGTLFIAVAIAIGYLPAALLRRRFGPQQPADTRALASDVMGRIGAVHGLILALVFASAHSGAQKFEDEVTAEASAMTQVYFNAQRLGAAQVQAASVAYLRACLADDWRALAERRELSEAGWQAWRELLDASLALVPEGRAETLLADKIHADVLAVESLRQLRGLEARAALPTEFWVVSITGLLLIATLLFVHEIRPMHQLIMALYSGFTGLTMFLIYDMAHPFRGAVTVAPDAFRTALATIGAGG